jgi:hypothetical protein
MKKLLFFALIIIFYSCSSDDNTPISGDNIESVSGSSRKKEIEFQRVQDSILKNYASAVKLINQIDNELNKLSQSKGSSESYNLEVEILQKIDYLGFQLKSRNEDIHKLEMKLKSLGKENKEFLEKIKTLETIIAEKDVIISTQNDRIANLESVLNITKTELDLAITEKQSVEKFANITEKEKNTAYYIIGTEKKLSKDNIIKMEGEGFLNIGGRYVPSTDSDLKLFTKIDITKDTLLPLPSNVEKIEIISTHSRRLLDVLNSPSSNDYLKVKNYEAFWRTDKMLIILIEEK